MRLILYYCVKISKILELYIQFLEFINFYPNSNINTLGKTCLKNRNCIWNISSLRNSWKPRFFVAKRFTRHHHHTVQVHQAMKWRKCTSIMWGRAVIIFVVCFIVVGGMEIVQKLWFANISTRQLRRTNWRTMNNWGSYCNMLYRQNK